MILLRTELDFSSSSMPVRIKRIGMEIHEMHLQSIRLLHVGDRSCYCGLRSLELHLLFHAATNFSYLLIILVNSRCLFLLTPSSTKGVNGLQREKGLTLPFLRYHTVGWSKGDLLATATVQEKVIVYSCNHDVPPVMTSSC